jgi:hypothetical protein
MLIDSLNTEDNSIECATERPRKLRPERFLPATPQSLAEAGLTSSYVEQSILKILYFRGALAGTDISSAMGLHFTLVEDSINFFKGQQMIQVKNSLGYGPASEVVSLTEAGRRAARDYLEVNQYTGPAPVPLSQYAAGVEAQRMPPNWLSPERLAEAYSHMTVSSEMLSQIGPAVNSGKSFLIYGQSGNGKTSAVEALFRIRSSDIFVPYALECQGNIIQLFDPLYHEPVPDKQEPDSIFAASSNYDHRWVRCRRPSIVTGGELSLSMLDLSHNPISKVYDAPFQLKANNGIYLIDDFGRQKASPSEVLNRWIIPMERKVDYLSFPSGGKMTVPFETFLVFSTNLTPAAIGDEALLRRIKYKMLMRSPSEDEFRTIFVKVCESHNLQTQVTLIDAFIRKHYRRTGRPFRRCHPRDIVSQALDFIAFQRLDYALTEECLDWAVASCFLSEEELTEPTFRATADLYNIDAALRRPEETPGEAVWHHALPEVEETAI